MKYFKQKIVQLLLIIELCIFCSVYMQGKNGMQELYKKRYDNAQLKQKMITLQTELANIDVEINAWQTDEFVIEKAAREQLQMARKYDEIFYIE